MIGRVALPIVLATIIAVVVSFAVLGFISFVNLVCNINVILKIQLRDSEYVRN